MSRFAAALLLLLAAVLCCAHTALASDLCLNGTAALVRSTSAPQVSFCNDVDGCDIRFELSFDSATMDVGRWPLRVQLADGAYLSAYYPELTDVAFQCDSSGDITASTVVADGSQRARLIWTYAGASSVSCEYVMQTVDLAADYTSFEALLSYANDSGAASFDAMFITTDAAYSIAALSVQCPTVDSTTGSTTTDTTGASTTGEPPVVPSIGSCRYPLDTWKHDRRYAAEWLTVAAYTPICGISYADLAFVHGDARSLPDGFLALAQQVVAVALNAAMYSVELAQINDTTIADAVDVTTHSINCADTRLYTGLVDHLTTWNDNTATCAGGDVHANQHVGASSTCSTQRDAYLAWAIVVTCVAGCLLLCMCVVVLFFVFRRVYQRYPQLLGRMGDEIVRVGDEMLTPYGEAPRYVAAPASAANTEEVAAPLQAAAALDEQQQPQYDNTDLGLTM